MPRPEAVCGESSRHLLLDEFGVWVSGVPAEPKCSVRREAGERVAIVIFKSGFCECPMDTVFIHESVARSGEGFSAALVGTSRSARIGDENVGYAAVGIVDDPVFPEMLYGVGPRFVDRSIPAKGEDFGLVSQAVVVERDTEHQAIRSEVVAIGNSLSIVASVSSFQ